MRAFFAALQSSYNASASRRATRSSTWRIFRIRSFLHRLMNTGQLSAGMWFSLSRYRLHISASTGVCTLPSELFPKPTALQMAWLELTPRSQSARLRLSAARNRLSNRSYGRRFAIPSVMASSVRDEIQRRRQGCLHPRKP